MTLPSWWEKERQDRNRRSRSQETKRAAQKGGRPQAGSGSSWKAPHDVVLPDYLEELKFTDKDSYSINVEYWKRLKLAASRLGREPRMIVDFPKRGVRLIITEEEI